MEDSAFDLATLQIGLSNYLLTHLTRLERSIFLVAGVAYLSFVFSNIIPVFVVAIALSAIGLFWHWRRVKKDKLGLETMASA